MDILKLPRLFVNLILINSSSGCNFKESLVYYTLLIASIFSVCMLVLRASMIFK